MYGLDPATTAARTTELLEFMGLANETKKLVTDFSHGMQKKLALAAAVIHGPKVLFLDEPFEGVDAIASGTLKAMLQGMIARGATIFLTSHVLEIVERLCSHIAIIDRGRLIANGSLEELRAGVQARNTDRPAARPSPSSRSSSTSSATKPARSSPSRSSHGWANPHSAPRPPRDSTHTRPGPPRKAAASSPLSLNSAGASSATPSVAKEAQANSPPVSSSSPSWPSSPSGPSSAPASLRTSSSPPTASRCSPSSPGASSPSGSSFVLNISPPGLSFDINTIIRFPLSFPRYLTARLFFGLLSAANVIGTLALIAADIGIAIARPSMAPWSTVLLATFALANIFMTRMMLVWVERWLSTRRAREVFTAFILFASLGFQYLNLNFNPGLQGRHHHAPNHLPLLRNIFHHIQPIAAFLPPGLTASSIVSASKGHFLSAIAALLGLIVFGALFFSVYAWRMHREFLGENLSELHHATHRQRASSQATRPALAPLSTSIAPDPRQHLRPQPYRHRLPAKGIHLPPPKH